MKKKIAKLILSSGTLATIAFIIILIPVLMIMDFFGANITDDYVENNAEYSSEYIRDMVDFKQNNSNPSILRNNDNYYMKEKENELLFYDKTNKKQIWKIMIRK